MKTIKHRYALILLLISSIIFTTACGGDDDPTAQQLAFEPRLFIRIEKNVINVRDYGEKGEIRLAIT